MQLWFSLLWFRPWHVAVKFCNTGSVRLYEGWLFSFLPYLFIKKEIKIRPFGFASFAFSSLFVVCFQDRITSKFTYPVGIILIFMTNTYQKRKEEKRKKDLAVFSLKTMHESVLFTAKFFLPRPFCCLITWPSFKTFWLFTSIEFGEALKKGMKFCALKELQQVTFSARKSSYILSLCVVLQGKSLDEVATELNFCTIYTYIMCLAVSLLNMLGKSFNKTEII